MKGLWWAAAGLLVLLGLCVAAGSYVRSSSESLCTQAQVWQAALESEDAERAAAAAAEFERDWQRRRWRLACLLEHDLLSKAEEARQQVVIRTRLGQLDEAAAEAERLIGSLRLMSESERNGLDNIL